MSYTSLAAAMIDDALIRRVRAAVAKEAFANETLGATQTGIMIRANGPDLVLPKFMWPVVLNGETAYEYALGTENPNPGGDIGVISDADIGTAIQVNWPEDVTPLPVGMYLQVVSVQQVPQ